VSLEFKGSSRASTKTIPTISCYAMLYYASHKPRCSLSKAVWETKTENRIWFKMYMSEGEGRYECP